MSTQPVQFTGAKMSGEGVPEILPEQLIPYQSKVRIIDVRRPDEFTGELGHIQKAELATLETDFAKFVETLSNDETYVFVCRSGGRSARAAGYALSKGLSHSYNLIGGMIYWNSLGLPVEK